MMKSVFFKQSKPITIRIVGVVILLMTASFVYDGTPPLSQKITMATIAILLLAHSISYEIKADFTNKKHFKLFGKTVFTQDLHIHFPDYIIVFSARFKKNSDWGPVAAMGNKTSTEDFVIRLFKGNKHFTVFKTSSLELANTEANKLGMLLNVSVRLKK